MCTPPTNPQAESRGGQDQGKETPDSSKIKGPYVSGFTYTSQKGWELVYAQGGNKAIWENNKYFLSIYLFIFLTFSYILLAYRFCQYVSHIYYIYLYISTTPLSRGPPEA